MVEYFMVSVLFIVPFTSFKFEYITPLSNTLYVKCKLLNESVAVKNVLTYCLTIIDMCVGPEIYDIKLEDIIAFSV